MENLNKMKRLKISFFYILIIEIYANKAHSAQFDICIFRLLKQIFRTVTMGKYHSKRRKLCSHKRVYAVRKQQQKLFHWSTVWHWFRRSAIIDVGYHTHSNGHFCKRSQTTTKNLSSNKKFNTHNETIRLTDGERKKDQWICVVDMEKGFTNPVHSFIRLSIYAPTQTHSHIRTSARLQVCIAIPACMPSQLSSIRFPISKPFFLKWGPIPYRLPV